ncbi:non-hydrolyzing UDP-N-acetylglucosamine 2-epimerase [Ferviditalea candida]|uniref:UDP-N-acetylglucosamine 2-epimerase (non-hydrolyzing) n=1 Tax=Ferviditalea candida TaxID=3108399 RepID=A0ABU5ZJ83_9BACL|nr:UDP-N-acetylglucosamine 2-epimerase (non-hydrolyzing) [Paenibacillaceae bacterium T2]
MGKLKVMTIFGVRPEAIKMAPLIQELQRRDEHIESKICVTAQHRQMLDQVLDIFKITPDYDLNIMREKQTLTDTTVRALEGLAGVFGQERPDLVLVHGDTLTTFVASLAAYYHQIPVGHVEAGLRTWDKYSPFPEELNRQLTGVIADLHFAPTDWSANNLKLEHKPENRIFITGNTVVDALKTTYRKDFQHPILRQAGNGRMLFVTAHRRENLGEPMHRMFRAIRRLVDDHPDVFAVYPVHLNPVVQEAAREILGGHDRIFLIDPVDVIEAHNFIARAYMILTDSGGIQEEAPAFGKPVLVLRDTTERPEGLEAGTLKLVGTDKSMIYSEGRRLLTDQTAYEAMSRAANPYGDGKAAQRIADAILYHFGIHPRPPAPFKPEAH